MVIGLLIDILLKTITSADLYYRAINKAIVDAETDSICHLIGCSKTFNSALSKDIIAYLLRLGRLPLGLHKARSYGIHRGIATLETLYEVLSQGMYRRLANTIGQRCTMGVYAHK